VAVRESCTVARSIACAPYWAGARRRQLWQRSSEYRFARWIGICEDDARVTQSDRKQSSESHLVLIFRSGLAGAYSFTRSTASALCGSYSPGGLSRRVYSRAARRKIDSSGSLACSMSSVSSASCMRNLFSKTSRICRHLAGWLS
jgi:hypothetical protein